MVKISSIFVAFLENTNFMNTTSMILEKMKWNFWNTEIFLDKHCYTKFYAFSCSAHRTPNFTNLEYFVCLLFEYSFQIKVLNWYQNSVKIHPNMPIQLVTLKRKKKNTLQHFKLGKLKFGIRKIGCSMSWTRYISIFTRYSKIQVVKKNLAEISWNSFGHTCAEEKI